MSASRVGVRQQHGEFSDYVVEVDGALVCVVAAVYVTRPGRGGGSRGPDWTATRQRAERIAAGLRLVLDEAPEGDAGRADLLDAAAGLLDRVAATLDTAHDDCGHCRRPTFRNWSHYLLDKSLRAIAGKLRRHVGSLRSGRPVEGAEGGSL